VKYEVQNPRYEIQRGSGDYMSTREMLERSGRGHLIDPYDVPKEYEYLIDLFWRIKSISGGIDAVIAPAILRDYCLDQGVLLNRQERGIIYSMDATLRGALADQRRANDKYMMQKANK
jgi:hypothetical protein